MFLFDENYSTNLMRFFDPQELRKEYGGQVERQYNYENMLEHASVQDFVFSEVSNQD